MPIISSDFDGLVVEGPSGIRLLALPTAVLELLRDATVIQYKRGDSLYRMRVSEFADGRVGGIMAPPANPSPTTPPPADQDLSDPANIPLRVRRGGVWVNVYVTRAQYEEYRAQGRIVTEEPGPTDTEGTSQ